MTQDTLILTGLPLTLPIQVQKVTLDLLIPTVSPLTPPIRVQKVTQDLPIPTVLLNTTDTGADGDSGFADSNSFSLNTTDTGAEGDSGFADSNGFALNTTDTGAEGESDLPIPKDFSPTPPIRVQTVTLDLLIPTVSPLTPPIQVQKVNQDLLIPTVSLNTTDTGADGESGFADSNSFSLNTTDTGADGDSGFADSNGFALNTTDTGADGDSGYSDSNGFALNTTDTGADGDSGFADSNGFALDTTEGNSSVGHSENIMVHGGYSSSPYYDFNNSNGMHIDIASKVFFRGSSYIFEDNGVNSSHPFMVGESYGDTNSPIVSGGPLNGSGGQITLSIPLDFNGSLYYFCMNHGSMIAPLILGDQGHPVFELNSTALLEISGQSLPSGNYAIVESNESTVDLEPALQDENGTWLPTPASDYVNLVPARFALYDDLKAWFDNRSYQPVGYLHFDDNGTSAEGNEDSSIPTANLQLWLDGLDIDGIAH